MGLLDKLKAIKDRDEATLDEVSPFADEDPDEYVEPDGDDGVHAPTKGRPNG